MQISDVSAANDSSLEPCGDIPAPAANAQVLQLASRLCNLLKADMDRFEQQEDMSLEARTKAMMAFAKTIQFLEELIRHHFLTMGPTSWIAFLASVFDLLRRLLAVWSDRKATREENTDQSLRDKAVAFDWLLKAIKARRNVGNDIPDQKDVDGRNIGDDGSIADRLPNQRYRRD